MSRCTITVVIHCFVYQVSLQKIPLEMASSQEKWNIRKQISFSFKRHSICCLAQLIWIQFTTDLCIMNMQGGQVNYVICGSSWQWVELKIAFGVFCMIQLCDWWNFLNSITSNVVFHPKFLKDDYINVDVGLPLPLLQHLWSTQQVHNVQCFKI